MSKKIKEPAGLVEVNNYIKAYGGMYANWKGQKQCKMPIPDELIERLIELQSALDSYLFSYKAANE